MELARGTCVSALFGVVDHHMLLGTLVVS